MHNQRGFSLIPALFVLIAVGLGISVGYALWANYQNSKTTNSVKVNNVACTEEVKLCPDGSYVGRTGPDCEFAECSAANTNINSSDDSSEDEYLQITEWGVELPITEGVEYTYVADSGRASFSTIGLEDHDYCGSSDDGIGIISRYTSPIPEGPLRFQDPIQINDWYYYYTRPQSACSPNATIVEMQTLASTALEESFAGLRESVDEWQTYTNAELGIEFEIRATDNTYYYSQSDAHYIDLYPTGEDDHYAYVRIGSIADQDAIVNDEVVSINGHEPVSEGVLSGQPANIFLFRPACDDGPGCGPYNMGYALVHNDTMFSLWFVGDDQLNDVERHILSTFEFTE
ncbi:MAG: hypothetical protein H6760_05250 [Candidatus Nomurabacteria bacterium]|nr:MAG: hypothetical protein H6760_05250 [Candidatus Nomurabacteria bacterium]